MKTNPFLLVVEDSRSFARMAAHALQTALGVDVQVADSLAAAARMLHGVTPDHVQIVTGLSLPDGSDAEVVRFFAERGHAPVVLTALYDDVTRARMLELPVADYVPKDSPACLEVLTVLVRRCLRNRTVTALVVEDSVAMRQHLCTLLTLQGFHVLTAADGREGLAVAARHPDIRLVLTDYAMPVMDGIEMIRELRRHHPREEMAIIGLSGSAAPHDGGALSARFLKGGASDFLTKPFEREELDCRIALNLDMLDSFAQLRDMAIRDFLTGLYNRRHFFARAASVLRQAARPAVVMIDVDWFKRINDTHGHDAGDMVLRDLAAVLSSRLREGDVLARFGGEEFCLLTPDLAPADAPILLERLRAAVANHVVTLENGTLTATISIGAALGPAESIDALLARADSALYRAKQGGRNRFELG